MKKRIGLALLLFAAGAGAQSSQGGQSPEEFVTENHKAIVVLGMLRYCERDELARRMTWHLLEQWKGPTKLGAAKPATDAALLLAYGVKTGLTLGDNVSPLDERRLCRQAAESAREVLDAKKAAK